MDLLEVAQRGRRVAERKAWIDEGLLDGSELNAADFQFAASAALLLRLADVAPYVEGRGAGQLARRVCPDFPGEIGPVLPAQWLAPPRSGRPPARTPWLTSSGSCSRSRSSATDT